MADRVVTRAGRHGFLCRDAGFEGRADHDEKQAQPHRRLGAVARVRRVSDAVESLDAGQQVVHDVAID